MAIEVGKPDYYVVLKKRRRTVSDFLAQHDINTRKKLNELIQFLEKEHLVTDVFRKEAEKYLAKVELETKQKKVDKKPELEEINSLEGSTKEKSETADKLDEESVSKPKKRSKRSAKKSKVNLLEKDSKGDNFDK